MTGEAGRGQAHNAHEAEHFGEVINISTPLNQATEVNPHHGDFFVEADELASVEVGEVGSFELAGVEAVLEGAGRTGRLGFRTGPRGSGGRRGNGGRRGSGERRYALGMPGLGLGGEGSVDMQCL